MKKTKRFLCVILSLLLCAFCFWGCAESQKPNQQDSGTTPATNDKILISKTSLSLDKTEKASLSYTYSGANGVAVWSSSNAGVADVSSDGVVTAVDVGVAIVRVTIGEKYAECQVQVYDSFALPQLVLERSEARLIVGGTFTISASVSLRGKTVPAEISYAVSQSDAAVATVNASGEISAKTMGIAQVIVSTTYDGTPLVEYFDVAVVGLEIED